MNAALAAVAGAGFEPTGVLTDDEAFRELASENYAAVTIGGGVELGSREAIKTAASEHGTIALDVFGLEDLVNKLKKIVG